MSTHTTLADVARLAGVSKTAASLVLNERPNTRLAAGTAQRVRDAARQLDYRPNPSAKSLRTGTTRTVGVISIDVITTRYASAMIAGALEVTRATDHTLLISESNGDAEQMGDAIEAMLDRRADGILFAGMAAKMLELPRLPPRTRVLLVNGTGSRGEPAVLPQEHEAGVAVAEELLRAGHRRIAIVGHPTVDLFPASTSVTIGSRLNGIRAAFARAGVEPALRLDDLDWEPDRGFVLTERVLEQSPGVTALLCMNDRLAFGAYQALQEHGVRVPEEMSVASFDDDELARLLRPGLTTAAIPYQEMGRRAMAMLLAGESPEDPVLVPMPLRRRGSVAPPRP